MAKAPPRAINRKRDRKGAIAVLAALFLVIMMAMVAFVVDYGYVLVAQTELQRAADAAAHAAALEYRRHDNPATAITAARNVASDYVLDNHVTKSGAAIDKNWNNEDPHGDVVVGAYDFASRNMTFDNINEYNAVRVRIRRHADMNGRVPLFFARVMGHTGIPIEAEATAAIITDVGGFKIPPSQERVPFLPITVRIDHWYEKLSDFDDDWTWDPVTLTASNYSDRIPEVNIYPDTIHGGGNGGNGGNGGGNGGNGGGNGGNGGGNGGNGGGNGSNGGGNGGEEDNAGAGNFGTVNVGTSNNSASHLGDIIANGLTQEHLDFHGGQLALDSNGELVLGGILVISASIGSDLSSIIGKPVAIPLYATMEGTGNNASFTIVKFVGVRLVAVNLQGGDKIVMAQPADVSYPGVIPSSTATGSGGLMGESSDQVYSPVAIVK